MLIIITGHPGTGKTSIGRALSKELKIPLISKDELKERIFDTLGHSDKEWSLKVSAAAYRIMDYLVEEELSYNRSLILESNFKADIDSRRFTELAAKHNCDMVQLLVTAPGSVIFERFMARMNSPERHAGHQESADAEEIRQSFLVPYPPLQIKGRLIEVDTSDFQKVDIQELIKKLKN